MMKMMTTTIDWTRRERENQQENLDIARIVENKIKDLKVEGQSHFLPFDVGWAVAHNYLHNLPPPH